MPRTPTGLVTDRPAAWSIEDAARPITDLPGINDEADWVPGINLHWREASAVRWRHPSGFDGSDADISAVDDPSVWPAAVTTTPDVGSFTNGIKDAGPDPDITGYRSFTIYAPSVALEMSQLGSAADQSAADLRAHAARQLMAEFADSLYTKNPGLQRTADDASNTEAVDPATAMAILYANHTDAGGTGDAALTIPFHGLPYFFRRRLIEWRDGRIVDIYGNPVVTAPGFDGAGPITDPTNLETQQDPPADLGEGFVYISHRPYAAIGSFREAVGGDGAPRLRGVYAKANTRIGLAEAPAIVVVRPSRIFAVNTVLNEQAGP